MSFKCKFLRCNEETVWVEHLRSCSLEVTKGVDRFSMIVRDSFDSALIGDFPRQSIRYVESLNSVVLRIYTQSDTRVVRFFPFLYHLLYL